jgi:hypothetical protein
MDSFLGIWCFNPVAVGVFPSMVLIRGIVVLTGKPQFSEQSSEHALDAHTTS